MYFERNIRKWVAVGGGGWRSQKVASPPMYRHPYPEKGCFLINIHKHRHPSPPSLLSIEKYSVSGWRYTQKWVAVPRSIATRNGWVAVGGGINTYNIATQK